MIEITKSETADTRTCDVTKVSGSAGRPDDGNWRMLSSREREYLAKVESEARRADQLGINCRWLVAQLDEIHAALCPGHIGTWQDRAQKAVEAAKIISQNNALCVKKEEAR